MKTRIDDRLREEATLYRFRFSCGDCAYFDEDGRRCSEGYPLDAHVRADWERSELLFCKLFEGA